MANYYATARSNYFLVKDKEAFAVAMTDLGVGVWDDREDGRVGVYPDYGDSNGWPSYDPEEDKDIEFTHIVAAHLADDEVCVLQEVGAEKLHYLNGYAIAFTNELATDAAAGVAVSLEDIYAKAAELGNCTPAQY
jgi:hypothetical protein